jgi:predicted phage terminase large subunit-like protein
VLIEDAGSGTSLAQELRRQIIGAIAIRPDRDKVSRMAVASAQFEAGQVHLPRRASWLPEFEAELFAFPNGRYDDQCDSVSQALNHGARNPPMNISRAAIRQISQPTAYSRRQYRLF